MKSEQKEKEEQFETRKQCLCEGEGVKQVNGNELLKKVQRKNLTSGCAWTSVNMN